MKEAYRRYLRSDDWKDKREEVLAYYHHKCAVCDLDYRERQASIQVHHLYYSRFRRSIIGREHPYFHLRLLCSDHHPKGKYTRESIQLARKAYRFRKRWRFFFTPLRRLGGW